MKLQQVQQPEPTVLTQPDLHEAVMVYLEAK
jgi:hypothetical protein